MRPNLLGVIGLAVIAAAVAAVPAGTESRWGKVAIAASAGFAGVWLLGDVAGLDLLGAVLGGPAGVAAVYGLLRATSSETKSPRSR
jgi:hypothetical protein